MSTPDARTRVLIVDDDDDLRSTTELGLDLAGFVTAGARSGEEALDRARDFGPDVVLMDLQMPGMGGLAACRALLQDPAHRHVAVFIMTAHHHESAEVAARDAGAVGYIPKPFSIEALGRRVRGAAPTHR